MQKITPFLWYEKGAEEAAEFYTKIFKNSKITNTNYYPEATEKVSGKKKGSVMTVSFNLLGQEFTAINGGPIYKFSPAISFFVYVKSEKELDTIFKKLSENGGILMPLNKYPFAEKYAFINDKFGVSWQLMLSKDHNENITPSLLFVGSSLGKAEEAVKFYTKLFKDTKIDHLSKYESEENGNKVGTVKHSAFYLENQEFIAMDGAGPHKFDFTAAISFLVNCKDQKEVDYYWEKLTKDGEEIQCGWLKDKFGIGWQVIPEDLGKLMSDPDKEKSNRVMQAMLKMKKIDVKLLRKAYENK